jgi:hypothetical protein
MKKQLLFTLTGAGLILASVCLVSWKRTDQEKDFLRQSPIAVTDTVPGKNQDSKEYRMEDLDRAMQSLDIAMAQMNHQLKDQMVNVDAQVKMAMDQVKKLDMEKISRDVQASLAKIDWDKTNADMKKAMKEAQDKIKQIDMKEMEKELARAKEEIAKAKTQSKIDMGKIHEEIEKGLENARTGIEKAKKEISQMKEFTDALDKDGLINKKKAYKIEIRNGKLYLNDQLQSDTVTDKYRKYFKDENYTIKSDGEGTVRL